MAARYLVPGGTGDINSPTNWAASSGGASGASAPLTGDDIIIDVNSFNTSLNMNVISSCRSFVCSNYTGTVSINNTFNVTGSGATGNITLSPGMTITGLANFTKIQPSGAASVVTSNGVIFDCPFSYQTITGAILTITGVMQVNELIVPTNTTVGPIINGSTIRVVGNVTHNCPINGTATIELISSTPATINQVATRYLGTNLVINKGAGAFNQVDLYWGASARTLTYTSGLPNHTGTLFVFSNGTLNTTGMTWNTIAPQGSINFTSVCNSNKIGRTSINTAVSFAGTQGFNTNYFEFIFTSVSATTNIVFASAVQYNINTSMICTSENLGATPGVTLRCNSGIAIINLKENAFMKLSRMNVLNINASNKTLRTLRGTITNSVNCFKIDSNINAYSTTR